MQFPHGTSMSFPPPPEPGSREGVGGVGVGGPARIKSSNKLLQLLGWARPIQPNEVCNNNMGYYVDFT